MAICTLRDERGNEKEAAAAVALEVAKRCLRFSIKLCKIGLAFAISNCPWLLKWLKGRFLDSSSLSLTDSHRPISFQTIKRAKSLILNAFQCQKNHLFSLLFSLAGVSRSVTVAAAYIISVTSLNHQARKKGNELNGRKYVIGLYFRKLCKPSGVPEMWPIPIWAFKSNFWTLNAGR